MFKGDAHWRKIAVKGGLTYALGRPLDLRAEPALLRRHGSAARSRSSDIVDARVLGLFLDFDHHRPHLAGRLDQGGKPGRRISASTTRCEPKDFNQYGTRRGNHEVMMRGTFANIRIKNQMVPGVEGGVTIHYPSKQQHDDLRRGDALQEPRSVPLVVFAGKEYGTGSSRDWAAKGTILLGVRAVIAQSFERIHRSNLVGMGVLPLVFEEGTSWQTLGLKGDEQVTIRGLHGELKPRQRLMAEIVAADGGAQARAADLPHRYARRARLLQERRHPAVRAAPARGVASRGPFGQLTAK